MEGKIKIGITADFPFESTYTCIFRSFENLTALELCRPVVFGSREIALSLKEKLGVESSINIISKENEPLENCINLIDCSETMTQETEASAESGQDAISDEMLNLKIREEAFAQLQKGKIDALVITQTPLETGNDMRFLQSNLTTLVVPSSKETAISTFNEENVAALKEKLQQVHLLLQRDFDIQRPRIVILADTSLVEAEASLKAQGRTTPLENMIRQALDEHICIYGPMDAKQLLADGTFGYFDVVYALDPQKGLEWFERLNHEWAIQYWAGEEWVVTMPTVSIVRQKDEETCHKNLYRAIFMATDIRRHQEEYREIHQNPLAKLFHDKRNGKHESVD